MKLSKNIIQISRFSVILLLLVQLAVPNLRVVNAQDDTPQAPQNEVTAVPEQPEGISVADTNQTTDATNESPAGKTVEPTAETSDPDTTPQPEIGISDATAAGEAPQAATVESQTSIPLAGEAETAVDENASTQAAESKTAPGESIPDIVDAIQGADGVLVDAAGQPVALASQAAAEALTNSDPYIVRGGTTFRFVARGGCAAFKGDGSTCTESDTPVQAAINFAAAGETITIEAGTYDEEVSIKTSLLSLISAGSGNATLKSISLFEKLQATSGVFAPIVIVHNGASIQDGIDLVEAGGTVRVAPGKYYETATNRTANGNGPYQFGLYIGKDKSGITVQGVDADLQPITDSNKAAATVTTYALNNFGYSGVFVEGDNVTISGLVLGDNLIPDGKGGYKISNNKTVEVLGDGFKFLDNQMITSDGGSLYLNDWNFNKDTGSTLKSYQIIGNTFQYGASVDIASGAGYSGPVSDRIIRDNLFDGAGLDGREAAWAQISFNGIVPTVGWYKFPVGGATITGNTFQNGTQYVRSRGEVNEEDFDWLAIWCTNSYENGVVTLQNVEDFLLRPYAYSSSPYEYENVRRIGSSVEAEKEIAEAGDTILTADMCAELGICDSFTPTPEPTVVPTTEPTQIPTIQPTVTPAPGMNNKKQTVQNVLTQPQAVDTGILPVTGGLSTLSCTVTNTVELPDLRSVSFSGILCGYQAGLQSEAWDTLTGDMQSAAPKDRFMSGMTISLINPENQALDSLPAGITATLRFPLSTTMRGQTYTILYWNALANNGKGSWEEISEIVQTDQYVSAQTSHTGTFILVKK